jgi:protein-disulfide isomerase
LGLLIGLLIFWCAFSAEFSFARIAGTTFVGTLLVCGLAAAQMFGPSGLPAVSRLPAVGNADTGPGPNRLISVLDGSVQLAPHNLPMLGSPDAPKLIVMFFDYCCPHCRATHGYLLNGLPRYGDQLGVVLLPAPLNKKCNPYWEHDEPRFEHACELASLSLAVFKADPAAFAQFDKWLFESEKPRDPQEARRYAEELVTPKALEGALAGPAIAEHIATNVKAAHESKAERIPIIMSPSIDTIVGRPESEEELFKVLEKELGLKGTSE